ncbi:hypothetical protein JHK85_011400 [Glycine max]|nr:hypothetical protein JHK85_011400 [Glycine max]
MKAVVVDLSVILLLRLLCLRRYNNDDDEYLYRIRRIRICAKEESVIQNINSVFRDKSLAQGKPPILGLRYLEVAEDRHHGVVVEEEHVHLHNRWVEKFDMLRTEKQRDCMIRELQQGTILCGKGTKGYAREYA